MAADLPRLALALTALLLLASCAHPSADFDHAAASLGLRRVVVPGGAFHHAVYLHDGARTGTLHLYIDGDGTPWMGGYPTADPTPRNTLVLRLMARDPARSAYVGRPCYNGMNDAACAPPLWTRDRYGPEVLDSMTEAVRRLLAAEREQEIAWFGHSGGGTLAVLLAPRFTETRGVTTIAGVLDTAAWARAVAHEDLGGSLNPADQQPLPPAIRQRHYAGADDPVAPPRLMEAGARRLGGHLIVVEGFDHACCWEQAWNAILAEAPDF